MYKLYETVEGSAFELHEAMRRLKKQVMFYMESGWEVTGGVCILKEKQMGKTYYFAIQAMICKSQS